MLWPDAAFVRHPLEFARLLVMPSRDHPLADGSSHVLLAALPAACPAAIMF
jgi:hypothetical protein